MKLKDVVKKFENFELHHKVIVFILVMILTILITRILTYINDPTLIIKGFEMHHFYYGVILIIIVSLLFLFGKRHYLSYLILSAISIGLIADEFIFVIGKMQDYQYLSTWRSATIFSLIVMAIVLLINHLSNKDIK